MFGLSTPVSITLALFLVASAGRSAAADVEPNDVTGSATDSGLIDVGSVTVAGGVIGNGPLGGADRDLFFVEITAQAELPLLLTAEMTSADAELDGYLRVFDSAGYEIARNDDASHADAKPVLHTYVLAAGFYFVGVSDALNPIYSPVDASTGRAAGSGSYDLSIALSPAASLDGSIEPVDDNSVPVDALPFSAADQFIGDGEDGRLDTDRYVLTADGPATVVVTVTPAQFFALDPILSVEVAGASIGEHDVPRADDAVRRIEVAVLEAGDVEIAVTGTREAPDEAGERFGSVGFYDIAIDMTPVADQADGPFEPNDSLLEATQTGLTGQGTVQFSAFIGDGKFGAFRGDVDFYELPAPIHMSLHIEVTPEPGSPDVLQPVIQLYGYGSETLERAVPTASGALEVSFESRCAGPFSSLPETAVIGVAIMGARSRPPMDPLIPVASPYPTNPAEVPLSLHALDGGPGSTGGYTVTFTMSPGSMPTCGSEPDDSIGDVMEPILVGAGDFLCGGTLGDGPCDDIEQAVDLLLVTSTIPSTVMDIVFVSSPCGVRDRVVRLFTAGGYELAQAIGDAHLHVVLDLPGDYYIGVSNAYDIDYDPFVACSGGGWFDDYEDVDRYELEIHLTPPEPEPPPEEAGESEPRAFATSLDASAGSILELDPTTGETIASFGLPETPLGGGEGLAFSGTDLFALGAGGRYPFLYRLDPDTGEVTERTLTWFGTGIYGDVVAHAGRLYFVDILGKTIYAVSPDLAGPVKRLDVGANGIAMRGPIAATVGPNRLLVPDAADPSTVHKLDASTGALLSSISLGDACPCDADLDGDGDVDGDDTAIFDACDAISGVAFGCRRADLNCDGDVDSADAAILICQRSGPGVPPKLGCCPDELPTVSMRATSLAAVAGNLLLAGDWIEATLGRFSPSGASRGTVALDMPVGALAGLAVAPFGDADNDGDLDLIDWSALQACFTGANGVAASEGCDMFDFDSDADVDLDDYDSFQQAFTGSGL